jgi:hypothetical protein
MKNDITNSARDLEWEDEAFPYASEAFKWAMRSQRATVRAFLTSNLGRLDRVIESPGPPLDLWPARNL